MKFKHVIVGQEPPEQEVAELRHETRVNADGKLTYYMNDCPVFSVYADGDVTIRAGLGHLGIVTDEHGRVFRSAKCIEDQGK